MRYKMKEFSGNLEGQLEDVHKQGGAGTNVANKKFGYGGANQQDHIDAMKQPMTKQDRKINAMANQASTYLKNKDASTLSHRSFGSQGSQGIRGKPGSRTINSDLPTMPEIPEVKKNNKLQFH